MNSNRYTFAKRPLALLIAAHNEEMVLGHTLASAIAAGMDACDIYVVNDSSTDKTEEIALSYLGEKNVLSVHRSGKAKAILQAIAHFEVETRYYWMHIADADGVFASDYFEVIKSGLNLKYPAVTGHIQSLEGGWISKYRVFEYSVGLEIVRPIQTYLGVIPVIPGPTSIYRTDILSKLDFTAGTLTEDMDLTFQIHRLKLGKINFVPRAKTYTQDPRGFSDFYKQIQRWYRGNFQVILRHKIGFRAQRLDAYVSFVMLEQVLLIAQMVYLPLAAWWTQNYNVITIPFLVDFATFFALTSWASWLNKRPDVLGAFPVFYVLRLVNLYAFATAWYEIVVRRKFQSAPSAWSVAGRRYQITAPGIIK